MIIYNLYVVGVALPEYKANTPTWVHGHRPLAFAVSLELVQSDALDNDGSSKTANGRAVLSCASRLDALDVFGIKILPRHFQVVMGLQIHPEFRAVAEVQT